jgi:hypothetical protein
MNIVIRRSAVVMPTVENEESLAEDIDVGDVHALLYGHGEIDLADRLLAHLGPQDALDVAVRLRRVVRRGIRGRRFRDYRIRLSPSDAERIGLVATWYERVGQAGCRTWADLRATTKAATRPLSLLGAAGLGAGERLPWESQTRPSSGEKRTGIMPEWLDAPDTSVWSA